MTIAFEQLQTTYDVSLSDAERASFDDIAEQYHVGVTPEQVEDAHALLLLNDAIDHTDLQADTIAELKRQRTMLIGEFMDSPEKSFKALVLDYARLSESRSLVTQPMAGMKTTEFVTANKAKTEADLHFRLSEYDDGTQMLSITMPFRGEMYEPQGVPFMISTTSDGGLSVQQFTGMRGESIELPLGTDGRAEERLEQFFLSTTAAVDLALNRLPDEQEEKHETARRLLYKKRLASVAFSPQNELA